MVYVCDHCHFEFERMSEIEQCRCGRTAIRENMPYDALMGEYTCQNVKKLKAVYEGTRKSSPVLRALSPITNVRIAQTAHTKRTALAQKATAKCRFQSTL